MLIRVELCHPEYWVRAKRGCWGLCFGLVVICPTLHPHACFGVYLHLCIRCCTLCVCVCDCLLLCSQEVPGSLQGAASGVLYPLQPDKFWGKLLMELDRNCDQDTKGIHGSQLVSCTISDGCIFLIAGDKLLGTCSPRSSWGSIPRGAGFVFIFLHLHGKARCGPGLMEGARNLLTHPTLFSHP